MHRLRFGVFSGGFGGGMGMGGRAFRAGRRLASGDLQLVLLALLAERASHGYELIKALEERSGGFYSPSPGMVYPALTWLEAARRSHLMSRNRLLLDVPRLLKQGQDRIVSLDVVVRMHDLRRKQIQSALRRYDGKPPRR